MIKELTELVSLSQQALPNAEDLLVFLSRNNHGVMRLYHAIQTHTFRTEAEAIQKSNVGERTKFRQTARELLRCLEQMTLHLDFDKTLFDPLNNSRLRGFQLTAIAKSMAPLACKNGAKKAAEELLRIGETYGRPEFVVEAAKVLMDFVSVAGDDPGQFDGYYQLYQQYSQWRMLEEKSVIYFDKTKLPSIKMKMNQQEWAFQAQQYVEELEPYAGIINSHNFHVSFYSIKSYRYTLEARHNEASAVHEDAIQYFSNRPYPCNSALNIFHYLEITNSLYSGSYLRGNRYYGKALELAVSGSFNWFSTLELGFYLNMHQGEYLRAAEIYVTAVRHKRFSILRESQRETWQILGAYLFIVNQLTGFRDPAGLTPKVKSTRFRNDVKSFAHDKRGMNVPILAAALLLEFVEGRHDHLWDRIAALEKYRERYLRDNDATHRSQLFIKALVVLSRHGYDGHKFLEKVQPCLEELRNKPLHQTNQSHELEIVPFERLIKLIAESLLTKKGSSQALRHESQTPLSLGSDR